MHVSETGSELFYAITTTIFSHERHPQHPGRHSGPLRCVFLPMVFGGGGGSFTPTSEWTVANTGAPAVPIGLVLVALLLLSVLFISAQIERNPYEKKSSVSRFNSD
jgi:hypothetical protein